MGPGVGSARADRAVDVAAVLDRGPVRGLPLAVAAFTVGALVIDGFDLQALAFVLPVLTDDWHLAKQAFGPVLAAALVGQAVGAFAFGTLGDRFGRRFALCATMAVVALGTLGAAFCDGPRALGLFRLLAGLGLGGSIPNATALMVEFAPRRARNLLVAVTVVGVPIGGMVGAEIAARLLAAYGWRAVFVLGAALPAALAAAMYVRMPESPRFLAVRPRRHAELAGLLNRVAGAGTYSAGDAFVVPEPGATAGVAGPAALFAPGFRRDTVTLWVAFFCNVFAVYAFFNWLPTVLTSAGLPLAVALRGSLVFNLGGVAGSVLAALAMNRYGSTPVVRALAVLGVVATAALGLVSPGPAGGGVPTLLATMAVAGVAVLGLQVTMYGVAANAYPTALRATGVGWALGVARAGGVLSSFAGAALLALAPGGHAFFFGIAAVLAVAALGVAALRTRIAPLPLGGRRRVDPV